MASPTVFTRMNRVARRRRRMIGPMARRRGRFYVELVMKSGDPVTQFIAV